MRRSYRRALLVVYAHTKDRDGGGLRASGWGYAGIHRRFIRASYNASWERLLATREEDQG